MPLPAHRGRGRRGRRRLRPRRGLLLSERLQRSARRVEAALAEHGLGGRVRELPGSTRTAVEAAAAVGCEVGQIVKSLVFRTEPGDAVLVVASGANRVDEGKVEVIIGEPVAMADADFVRERTGYAIGGVPPLAHATELAVVLDEDLARYEEVWAAAGTPRAVFPLSPSELVALTGGRVAAVAR